MKRHWFAVAIIGMASLISGMAQSTKKTAKAPTLKQVEADLAMLLDSDFPRWDRNGDGKLVFTEMNAVIENPEVCGDEAAAIVAVRQHFAPKGAASGFTGATRDQVLAVAGDADTARKFAGNRKRIQTISRELFLPGDPNLDTFHQGGTGDCYLLSVVGTLLNRNSAVVRDMIRPLPGNGFRVRFPDGRIENVLPPTDAELLMGARVAANHGLWLSVLEKAYASIREESREKQTGKVMEDDEATEKDLLGGGSTRTTIGVLTGHKATSAPSGKWLKENPAQAEAKLHDLLVKLAKEHKLMAAGTGKADRPLPKHIAHSHAFGIFGYDGRTRMLRMFNPWGNDVKPDDPPGLVNGYATHNGVFDVPLHDFLRIFNGVNYETDKPLQN